MNNYEIMMNGNEISLIKIIYGLRRSEKSVILTQIIDEINAKGISVNELFSGEIIKMENYNLKAEENLLD